MGIISPNYGDTYATTTGEKEGQFSKGEAKNINHSSPGNTFLLYVFVDALKIVFRRTPNSHDQLAGPCEFQGNKNIVSDSLRISLFLGGTQVTILLSCMWTIWYIN